MYNYFLFHHGRKKWKDKKVMIKGDSLALFDRRDFTH